ncbi:SDR family oxidoreductase [Streptomyces sp. NBC_01016]|uniref:SDR family oxidoreductase n=1 Tax=Streptomyces sp. NBC_01016 TaxID=2903720 RepID=UPI002258BD42|nr:SDR family oxidoreductase [Streptomyces sp. NBC_01016]MCX4831554.1 SDR family oxidoreductase [Streptomyces sp. NBC_01016]
MAASPMAPTDHPRVLDGRAAVVTGASRGIGRAIAEELADSGALLCVTARDPHGVREAVAALRARGAEAVGVPGSVADPAHLWEVTERTMAEFGRVDIVVNNAATNQPYGPLMDADPDTWRTAFTMNVEAPLRLVQCAWRAWMSEHGGAVVNVCTEGAGHVGPNVGAYGTSKAALLHLTAQLAGEMGPLVRVNSVSPGLVRTEMARFVWERAEESVAAGLPTGRIGEPEDVARAVRWLASDEASWITGAELLVDGGTRVRAASAGGASNDAVHKQLRHHLPGS